MQATLAIAVAFYVTVGMFEAIWAVLLRDHGAETWLIGLTLSLFTVPMIFLAPIGGRTAQRRGPLHVVDRQPQRRGSLHVRRTACSRACGCCSACRSSTRSPTRSPCPGTRCPPRSRARREHASRPRRASSARPASPPPGSPGSRAGFLYEESGRLAVCITTAAVMGAAPACRAPPPVGCPSFEHGRARRFRGSTVTAVDRAASPGMRAVRSAA